MTNLEKLSLLYKDKTKQGLLDVKFDFAESARHATAEQLAGEVLAIDEAILRGKFRELDFGDYSLTIPRSGIGPVNKKK